MIFHFYWTYLETQKGPNYWYQQSFFVWCLLRQRNGEWNSGQKPATIVTDAFLLWNGTQSNNTCSYILLDHSNAFGLSRRIFFVANKLTNAYLMWGRGGGGWIFYYAPFWGPLEFWLDQTGTCTTWLWGLQYNTIVGSLWYLATEEMR